MIVSGIVIQNGWWVGGWNQGGSVNPIMGQHSKPTSPSISVVDPSPSRTTVWAKTEPRPFILVGGFPATVGTTVFSNTRVQEWVSGVLGWDEPTGPDGAPLAY